MKHLNNYITEALIKKHIDVINYPHVDLGLPSGNLWATCNLGAKKPEEYGNYYMWGSVENNSKSYCVWSTTPFNGGSNSYDYEYWQNHINEIIDNNNVLLIDNDVAHAELNGHWQIPNKDDYQELIDYTTSKFITYNKVKGRLFTSSKNNNTLFIPAAGFRCENKINLDDTRGYVWSSQLSEDDWRDSLYLYLRDNEVSIGVNYRQYGLSIRPIYKK